MIARFVKVVDLAAVGVLLWAGAAVIPLSVWFQPGQLVVASTKYEQQPALVLYDRTIHRRVFMQYSVVVRRLVPDSIACEAAGGPFWFDPKRQLPPPDELTLAWLAPSDPRCGRLPPGEYVVDACWTANVASLLPPKTACIQSNPFIISTDGNLATGDQP